MEEFKKTYLEWNKLLTKGIISKEDLLGLVERNKYYNAIYICELNDINLDILFEIIEEQIDQDCLYYGNGGV